MKTPRTVRNWWVEATIDGQQTQLVGGPKAADGGIWLKIYQRHNGAVITALEITGLVQSDGSLKLAVCDGLKSLEVKTKR